MVSGPTDDPDASVTAVPPPIGAFATAPELLDPWLAQ
jgi:hypothetical protein